MEYPLVSVCICTWNRKEKLQLLLESLLTQAYPNFEICIVDNASTDGTFTLIQNYIETIKTYPNIIAKSNITAKSNISVVKYNLTPEPDPNAIKTINMALEMGDGEFLMIVDDDAYFDNPNVISELVDSMNVNDKIAIVGANIKGEDGQYQMPVRRIDGSYIPDIEIDARHMFYYFEFHGATAMFRRSLTRQYGLYDESFKIYMNELDMALRYIARGYHVMINTHARVTHAGVGNINACNGRAKYFIGNYNTCILRNFRGFLRWKALFLHSFMSCGYYIERILMWNICSKTKVIPLTASFIPMLFKNIKSGLTSKPQEHIDQNYLSIIEKSFYNGFKRCITDRFTWLAYKRGLNRGIK